MTLTATDLFCGAGGSSLGAEVAGVRLAMGANHWPKAIEVHQDNFPDAAHDCADISQVNPRRYPSTDLLLASPECTNHSSAKGVSRKKQDPSFFDSPDLGAERSRATMWDVHRFVEQHRYAAVVVENVVDAARWTYWPSWWRAWDDAGYDARVLSINSAHTGAVNQWRDRIYVVAVRRGIHVDLDIRPPSWCSTCQSVVAGVQSFKKPGAGRVGKWRQQYHYRCPTCAEIVAPPAPPAADIIDWALPAGRIGDRKKPLAEATMRRIRLGIERYGAALVQPHHQGGDNSRVRSLNDPAFTASASRDMPAFVLRHFTARGNPGQMLRSAEEPMPTATGSSTHGLVVPNTTNNVPRTTAEPLSTVVAGTQRHALVVPMVTRGRARPSDAEPLNTCRAGGNPAGLLMAPQSDGRAMPTGQPAPSLTAKVPPMLVPYDSTGIARPVTDPAQTLTTRDRAALAMPDVDIDDCRFRMLEPHEVKAAMAFPADYAAAGTKAELVRLWGNAVTPPVMTLLVARVRAALEAR